MKLVVDPAAEFELQSGYTFYSTNASRALGLAFVSEFERCATLLLDNHELGKQIRGKARCIPFRRFPYNLIYQIALEELRVIAVAHQRRRPAYWAKRI